MVTFLLKFVFATGVHFRSTIGWSTIGKKSNKAIKDFLLFKIYYFTKRKVLLYILFNLGAVVWTENISPTVSFLLSKVLLWSQLQT